MRMTDLVILAVRRKRMTDASRSVTTNGAGGAHVLQAARITP